MDRSHKRVPHPGRVLLEEFLEAAGMSQNQLARVMDVPPRRVNEIVLGKRSITADTAVRLSEALGMSAEYWMSLQAKFDIDRAVIVRTGKYAKPIRPPDWMVSVPLDDEEGARLHAEAAERFYRAGDSSPQRGGVPQKRGLMGGVTNPICLPGKRRSS